MGYSKLQRLDDSQKQELFDMLEKYVFPDGGYPCVYTTQMPARSKGSANSKMLLRIFEYIRGLLSAAMREQEGRIQVNAIRYEDHRNRSTETGQFTLIYTGGPQSGSLYVKTWTNALNGDEYMIPSFRFAVMGSQRPRLTVYEIGVRV